MRGKFISEVWYEKGFDSCVNRDDEFGESILELHKGVIMTVNITDNVMSLVLYPF